MIGEDRSDHQPESRRARCPLLPAAQRATRRRSAPRTGPLPAVLRRFSLRPLSRSPSSSVSQPPGFQASLPPTLLFSLLAAGLSSFQAAPATDCSTGISCLQHASLLVLKPCVFPASCSHLAAGASCV